MTSPEEEIEVLGDLVSRDGVPGDTNTLALRSDGPAGGRYTYPEFARTARKTGNYLAHHHIGPGRSVGVAGDRRPPALLTLFGTALLGGAVHFEPPASMEYPCIVTPTERILEWEVGPGTARVAYGEQPTDPEVRHFERVVTSENPGFPTTTVAPEATVLHTTQGSLTHASVLAAAGEAREAVSMDAQTDIVIRSPLEDPGAVAAGVLAPLLAGGTVVLPDEDTVGDVAVAGGTAPESEVLEPATYRAIPTG